MRAVVLPRKRYQSALQAAPGSWGKTAEQKHNAPFLLRGITPRGMLAQLPAPKADLATVTLGPGVIFWSISKRHLTRTTFMKLPN